jgi:hypothetical protein
MGGRAQRSSSSPSVRGVSGSALTLAITCTVVVVLTRARRAEAVEGGCAAA